jgi:DNA-directed RNA polymerase subunit RPC12/RpoP
MAAVVHLPNRGPGGPKCPHCGAKTRLFGIEPHPDIERTELLTYVCVQCDGVQTKITQVRA